jgi:hypothetical protein
MKDFIKYSDSQYGEGIQVEEYNGVVSLVNAREGQDGKVYAQWCYPQGRGKGAGPIEKALPWKIKLGTKEEAVGILNNLLGILGADEDTPF